MTFLRKIFFSLVLILLTSAGYETTSQEYRNLRFGTDDDFYLDIGKAVSQDRFGFIWIASDKGLHRFDGEKFTHFGDDVLPSPYVKDIFTTPDSTLYAVTDLGIVRINSHPNKPSFTLILPGTNGVGDSILWYPKTVYTDKKGWWISEPATVVYYDGISLKKYPFPQEDHTFSYVKSFNILIDSRQDIYALSFPGRLHRFNKVADRFEHIPLPITVKEAESPILVDKDTWVFGGRDGLYRLTIINGQAEIKLFLPISEVSCLALDKSKTLFIGTEGKGLYSVDMKDPSYEVQSHQVFADKNVRALYLDNSDILWIVLDDEIHIYERQKFQLVVPEQLNKFTQGISLVDANNILIAQSHEVVLLSQKAGKYTTKKLFSSKDFYINEAVQQGNTVYFTTSTGQLYRLPQNGTAAPVQTGIYSNSYFSALADRNGNTWFCPTGTATLLRISENGAITAFDASRGVESISNIITSDRNGTIYAGGSLSKSYLLKFDPEKQQFINLSLPLKDTINGELVVNDMAVLGNGSFYLATNQGLFLQKKGSIERVNLGAFSDEKLYAVAVAKNNMVFIGLDKGLLRYYKNEVNLFTVADGLPGVRVASRTLSVDAAGRLWIGTSKGIAMLDPQQLEIRKSITPTLLRFVVDGIEALHSELQYIEIKPESALRIDYASLQYPATTISYQYRLIGRDSSWISLELENSLYLSNLPAGSYTLEIRAKQQGSFTFSDPLVISFSILPLWYQTWWGLLLIFSLSFIVLYILIKMYNNNLIKRNLKLEELVAERTSQLKESNDLLGIEKQEVEERRRELAKLVDELRELNATKDKFFSIISHDLRSPFQALLGWSNMLVAEYEDFDDDEIKQVLSQIERSAKNVYSLIENLLFWSRSQLGKLEILIEPLDPKQMMMDNVTMLQSVAEKKEITLRMLPYEGPQLMGDRFTITTVLRNLISNALKFTPRNGTVTVSAECKDGSVRVSVQDTGKGISKTDQEKLFNPGKNVSTPGTENEKGTGLGLILCKEFIEKNAGTIGFVSEEESGSTFFFKLPAVLKK